VLESIDRSGLGRVEESGQPRGFLGLTRCFVSNQARRIFWREIRSRREMSEPSASLLQLTAENAVEVTILKLTAVTMLLLPKNNETTRATTRKRRSDALFDQQHDTSTSDREGYSARLTTHFPAQQRQALSPPQASQSSQTTRASASGVSRRDGSWAGTTQ
jgi:hypothetical protein